MIGNIRRDAVKAVQGLTVVVIFLKFCMLNDLLFYQIEPTAKEVNP